MSTTTGTPIPAWESSMDAAVNDAMPLMPLALEVVGAMTEGLTAADLTGTVLATSQGLDPKPAAQAFVAKLKPRVAKYVTDPQKVHAWEQTAQGQHPGAVLFGAYLMALGLRTNTKSVNDLLVAISLAMAIHMKQQPGQLDQVTLQQLMS